MYVRDMHESQWSIARSEQGTRESLAWSICAKTWETHGVFRPGKNAWWKMQACCFQRLFPLFHLPQRETTATPWRKKNITKNCRIRHSPRRCDEAQATEIHDGDQKICQNEIIYCTSRRMFTMRRALTGSPLREVMLFRLLFYTESGPQNPIAREKRIRR